MDLNSISRIWRIAAAFSVAALAACSSSTVDEPDEEQMPLTFKVSASDSRAMATKTTFETDGCAFNVWGLFYNPFGGTGVFPIFDARTVTLNSGVWSYKNEEYWMPGFTYEFRALYPATLPDGATVAYTTGTGANSHISVSNFTARGTDLMSASDQRIVLADGSTQPAVDLKFRHLLSRVTFKGRSDDRYLGADGKPDATARKIKVTSFKVSGIADIGTWDGTNFAADGSNLGGWTRGEQTATYTAPIDAAGLELGNDPVDIFGSNDVILAIPQAFTALKIEITYVFTEGTQGEQHATSTLAGTWLPGKSYSYNFALNTHIFFDIPVVEDWTTAPVNNPDLNIDLPRNNP